MLDLKVCHAVFLFFWHYIPCMWRHSQMSISWKTASSFFSYSFLLSFKLSKSLIAHAPLPSSEGRAGRCLMCDQFHDDWDVHRKQFFGANVVLWIWPYVRFLGWTLRWFLYTRRLICKHQLWFVRQEDSISHKKHLRGSFLSHTVSDVFQCRGFYELGKLCLQNLIRIRNAKKQVVIIAIIELIAVSCIMLHTIAWVYIALP